MVGFLRENYIFLVMLAGVLLMVFGDRRDNSREQWSLVMIAVGLAVVSVLQYAERELAAAPDYSVWRLVLSSTVYALYPVLVLPELLYLVPKSRHRLLVIPAAANAVLCAVNACGVPLICSFTADNRFYRGPLGFLPFAAGAFYLVMFSVVAGLQFRNNRALQRILFYFITVTGLGSALLESMEVVRAVNAVGLFDVLLYNTYLSVSARLQVKNDLLESENARLHSEMELQDSKMLLLSRQIHRHFIYNSLVALKSLCRRDPASAERFAQDFADYLRFNLEIMGTERIVPFPREKEYILKYLAIEQADPASRFTVTWDVETDDFLLPALSVEPLVENAVQHGVADSDINGRITIRVRKEPEQYVIEVEDNGLGIPDGPSAVEERTGVGISNIRARLRAICDGTLDVTSDQFGTVARITLPASFSEGYHNEDADS